MLSNCIYIKMDVLILRFSLDTNEDKLLETLISCQTS